MTKPQCVLCNAVLIVEAMKPSKLLIKRHLNTKHPEHRKEPQLLRRQRIDFKTAET